MAKIAETLIWCDTKTEFEKRKTAGDVQDESIAFIKDEKAIWTHGEYFFAPYSKSELETKKNDLENKFKDSFYEITDFTTQDNPDELLIMSDVGTYDKFLAAINAGDIILVKGTGQGKASAAAYKDSSNNIVVTYPHFHNNDWTVLTTIKAPASTVSADNPITKSQVQIIKPHYIIVVNKSLNEVAATDVQSAINTTDLNEALANSIPSFMRFANATGTTVVPVSMWKEDTTLYITWIAANYCWVYKLTDTPTLTKLSLDEYKAGEGLSLDNHIFKLVLATDTTLGGIKVGYTANGTNYPIQLSDGKAYVNVPYTTAELAKAVSSTYIGVTKANRNTLTTTKGIAFFDVYDYGWDDADNADHNIFQFDSGKEATQVGVWDSHLAWRYNDDPSGAGTWPAQFIRCANMNDIPTRLPNPKALTVLGVTYDGTAEKTVTIPNVSNDAAGLMTPEEKKKLDGVADGANKYVLPKATDTTLGGVKLGNGAVLTVAANTPTNTTGKTYAVQLTANDLAVVNVPWVNTTYPVVDSSHNGLMTPDMLSKLNGALSGDAGGYTSLSDFVVFIRSTTTDEGLKITIDDIKKLSAADVDSVLNGQKLLYIYAPSTSGSSGTSSLIPVSVDSRITSGGDIYTYFAFLDHWYVYLAEVHYAPNDWANIKGSTLNKYRYDLAGKEAILIKYNEIKLLIDTPKKSSDTIPVTFTLTDTGLRGSVSKADIQSAAGSTGSASPTLTISAGNGLQLDGDVMSVKVSSSAAPSNNTKVTLVADGNGLSGYMSNADIKTAAGTTSGGYTLPTATASILGGVKLASDTKSTVTTPTITRVDNRTYGIQANSNGLLVVNVPWENTTGTSYTLPVATASQLGGVKLGSDTVQALAAVAVLSTSGRTYAVLKNSSDLLVVNVPWTDTKPADTSSFIKSTSIALLKEISVVTALPDTQENGILYLVVS